MKPVVSVILLIGEGSRSSVMRSINCLLRQTACEPEIVAVNIGSEGYGVSVSLQEDYAENRQITFVSLLEDPGDNYRNYTLRYARGEYVCFMKGGEIWTEEKLERQIALFRSDEKASAVISNGVYTLRDGENTAGGTFFAPSAGDSSGDGRTGDGPAGWMLRCPVITSGQVLYKLDALKEIGKFSSSFQCLSDLDAICRISRAGRVLFDPARNVNCEITDSLRKKRRRFLEYEKLLFDRLYIDRMLSDRKCFNSYYRNLVSAAVRAGYPVEVLQYSVIAFIRFPVANTKLLFLGTVRAIGSMICGMKNKCLLKGYSGDIRKTALGMRAKAKTHKYGILRVGRDKRAAFTAKEAGEIPDFRYAGGELDGTFHVPAGTLRIGEGAFAGCRRLRRIVLPDTVSYIGARAFMDCEQLESVTCSSGSRLVRIDKYAFAGCTSLAEVTLPGDLSHMGRGAFIGCAGLGSLTFLPSLNGNRTEADFADRMPILEPECFAGCCSLHTVRFGKASMLSRIGKYAFYNCRSLSLIWIESSLEAIGKYAFAGCKGVSEIVMPKMYMINSIGAYAFAECEKLKWFTFPTNTATVSEGVFQGCTGLSNCTVPPTVNRIRKYAFSGCTGLLSCVIGNKHAKVSRKAFDKHTRIVFGKSELLGKG